MSAVWFGLEFVAFWALVIAVLNYMPYIGSVLGVLLPMSWAIVQFDDLGTLLTLLLLLSLAQFVIGYFLDPFLMGNSLNLSPFVILASLTVWASLWGIAGRLPRGSDRLRAGDRVLRIPWHPTDRGADVARWQARRPPRHAWSAARTGGSCGLSSPFRVACMALTCAGGAFCSTASERDSRTTEPSMEMQSRSGGAASGADRHPAHSRCRMRHLFRFPLPACPMPRPPTRRAASCSRA